MISQRSTSATIVRVGMSTDGYTLLRATADEEEKSDCNDLQTPQAQIVDDVEGSHNNWGTASVMCPSRPKYDVRSVEIPGSVTRFEQDMISLISTFSGTHSTEAGRYFVEHLSRVTGDAELTTKGYLGRQYSRIIMWPTHGPDVKESVDGDFCSDVNWIFAYCDYDISVIGDSDCPMSATIIGSLYPLIPSRNYSKLYSTVSFEKPDKYMRPRGVIRRAATKAYSEYAKILEERSKQAFQQEIRQYLKYLTVICVIIIIIIFLFIKLTAH
jgi:hypothetical protein